MNKKRPMSSGAGLNLLATNHSSLHHKKGTIAAVKNINLLALVAFVVVSFALLPGATTGCAQDNVKVAKKLAELDRQWLDSARIRDAAALERLVAEGFTEVHLEVEPWTRRGRSHRSRPRTEISEIHPDQIVARHLFADVAITVHTTTIKGASERKDISGIFTVLRVFIN
jgi:hypothetical protein